MARIERLPGTQKPPGDLDWILVESDPHGVHIQNCNPRNGFLANQSGGFANLETAIVEAVRLADLNDVATVFVRDPQADT